MTDYKQGDIVLINFEFSNNSGSKKRPALVISNESYNKNRQEIIVLVITSNIQRLLPGDTLIEKWKTSGLIFPSSVNSIFRTFKNSVVIRKLGVLPKKEFNKVKNNFLRVIS